MSPVLRVRTCPPRSTLRICPHAWRPNLKTHSPASKLAGRRLNVAELAKSFGSPGNSPKAYTATPIDFCLSPRHSEQARSGCDFISSPFASRKYALLTYFCRAKGDYVLHLASRIAVSRVCLLFFKAREQPPRAILMGVEGLAIQTADPNSLRD